MSGTQTKIQYLKCKNFETCGNIVERTTRFSPRKTPTCFGCKREKNRVYAVNKLKEKREKVVV